MLRPTAISVTPQNDYIIRIKFDNGEEKKFDVKPYIKGEWYGQLRMQHTSKRWELTAIPLHGQTAKIYALMNYMKIVKKNKMTCKILQN